MARTVETPEFASFVRRVVRAYGRRVAVADPEDLAVLVELHAVLDGAIHEGVNGLRAEGHSWADIARPLGVTRQAAHLRWGARPEPRRVAGEQALPGL